MSTLNFLHSGGNKVSLTTPDSNPASNITFKLPQSDGTANQSLVTDGNGALSFATPSPYQFSSWYLTTNFNNIDAGRDVIENWAISNAPGYEGLGTAPTYSSGTFTFPSTGYWRVQASLVYYLSSADGDTFALGLDKSTDSGSSYDQFATIGGRLDGSLPANVKLNWLVQGAVKVPNASTFRMQVVTIGTKANIGYLMGGTQATASFSGATSTLLIEKMANL